MSRGISILLNKNMASMVAGGLFNAVAFAGAGFLFSKLNHRGYEKEMKRHNEAMEKLSRAKNKWYEDEVVKKDKLERMRQELQNAKDDFDEVNDALDNYRVAHEEYMEHKTKEPTIRDFYKPSNEMKSYENIVLGAIGLGCGWLISKVIL